MASNITGRQADKTRPLMEINNCPSAESLLNHQNLKLINSLSLTSTYKQLNGWRGNLK